MVKNFDLDIENRSREQKKSSIYKAKITRVEKSLEAAFVDFVPNVTAFYHSRRLLASINKKAVPAVKRYAKAEIIVQVEKEERGTMGAALTSYLSLAGRYMVLMPTTLEPVVSLAESRVMIDRVACRDVNDIPAGMGVIVRTAGVGRSSEELNWDLSYLLQLWEAIVLPEQRGYSIAVVSRK